MTKDKPLWAIKDEQTIQAFTASDAHKSKRRIASYIKSGISGEKLLRLVALHIAEIEKDAEAQGYQSATDYYEETLESIRRLL